MIENMPRLIRSPLRSNEAGRMPALLFFAILLLYLIAPSIGLDAEAYNLLGILPDR